MDFVIDAEYCDLLLQNQEYHKKVRESRALYSSPEYRSMQRRLLEIEVKMPSKDIVAHATYLFPNVSANAA